MRVIEQLLIDGKKVAEGIAEDGNWRIESRRRQVVISLGAHAVEQTVRPGDVPEREVAGLIDVQRLLRGVVEVRRPLQPRREIERPRAERDLWQALVDLRAAGMLFPRSPQLQLRGADLVAVIERRSDVRQRRVGVEGVLTLERCARHVVHVGRKATVARERLAVAPRQRKVRLAVPLPRIGRRQITGQEAVEPIVAPFSTVLHPSRVTLCRTRAAAPVEPGRRVHVVIDRKEVPDVLDVAAVRWIGADEIRDAKTRRQDAAVPPRTHVGEHERQPHYRDVLDVQDCRSCHECVRARTLHLVELEVVIRNRVGAARELTTKAIEGRAFSGRGIAQDRLPFLGADLPDGPRVRGEPRVTDRSGPFVETILKSPTADDVRLTAPGIVHDDGLSDRRRDFRALIEEHARVGVHGLGVTTLHDRPLARGTEDLEQIILGVEGDTIALVARDGVAALAQ